MIRWTHSRYGTTMSGLESTWTQKMSPKSNCVLSGLQLQVSVWNSPWLLIPLPEEKRGSSKHLPPPMSNRMSQTSCLERGEPLRTPLFQDLAFLLFHFSWESWRLQIVYIQNVSCPHMKIYTSLRPKYLRLEIDQTVSPADLLSTGRTTSNEH